MDTTMRQRLLLVAGWLAAAIGSGLVASGAVAIAGGQVLDRPQRLFTAAEVAALPVETVELPDDIEPHASGGLVPDDGDSTATDGDDAPTGDGTTGTRGSSASEDPPVDPFNFGASEARIEANEGGQASFAVANDRIYVLWATPNLGYVAQQRTGTDQAISVSFSSSRNVWLIDAIIRDGDLIVRSRQAPLT